MNRSRNIAGPAFALAMAASFFAASPRANAAAAGALPSETVLPIDLALDAAKVAIATCTAQGYSVAIAVVDRGGGLVLLAADHGSSSISRELSQRKARTAALFGVKSVDIGTRFQANPGFAATVTSIDSRLSGAQGAVPIMAGGQMLGAIGASGAPGGDKDEACVTAGLNSIAGRLR